MAEMLPLTVIVGMDDPRGWTQRVLDRMMAHEPTAVPQWRIRRDALRMVEWSTVFGDEPLIIQMIPYPDCVRLEVWKQSWNWDPPPSYQNYYDVVWLVGTQMIDQSDPDESPLRLVIQSFAEAQAWWRVEDV